MLQSSLSALLLVFGMGVAVAQPIPKLPVDVEVTAGETKFKLLEDVKQDERLLGPVMVCYANPDLDGTTTVVIVTAWSQQVYRGKWSEGETLKVGFKYPMGETRSSYRGFLRTVMQEGGFPAIPKEQGDLAEFSVLCNEKGTFLKQSSTNGHHSVSSSTSKKRIGDVYILQTP